MGVFSKLKHNVVSRVKAANGKENHESKEDDRRISQSQFHLGYPSTYGGFNPYGPSQSGFVPINSGHNPGHNSWHHPYGPPAQAADITAIKDPAAFVTHERPATVSTVSSPFEQIAALPEYAAPVAPPEPVVAPPPPPLQLSPQEREVELDQTNDNLDEQARECARLLRQMYSLDLKIWAMREINPALVPKRQALEVQADSVLERIQEIVQRWEHGQREIDAAHVEPITKITEAIRRRERYSPL